MRLKTNIKSVMFHSLYIDCYTNPSMTRSVNTQNVALTLLHYSSIINRYYVEKGKLGLIKVIRLKNASICAENRTGLKCIERSKNDRKVNGNVWR